MGIKVPLGIQLTRYMEDVLGRMSNKNPNAKTVTLPYDEFVKRVPPNDRRDIKQKLDVVGGKLEVAAGDPVSIRSIANVVFFPSPASIDNDRKKVDMILSVIGLNGQISEKYAGTFLIGSDALNDTEQTLKSLGVRSTKLLLYVDNAKAMRAVPA